MAIKTVKLKLLKDVDKSKIFPILNETLYSLVEGTTVNISTPLATEIKNKGYFTLGGLQISKDLIEVPSKSNNIEDVVKAVQGIVAKKSLFMDKLVEAVVYGILLKKNVMLYGKGGHNKSEGVLQTIEAMQEVGVLPKELKPFIKSLSDGTTTEELYGGVDMKLAMETGAVTYNTDLSFMPHKLVIFEEGFDAPGQVLSSLKDTMTSKALRNGHQQVPLDTETFIVITNKSKEEMASNDSIEALMQRFHYTCKVEWDKKDYTRDNFAKLFALALDRDLVNANKDKLLQVAKLCQETNKSQEYFISPRSAVSAAELYAKGGSLCLISDFNPKDVEAFMKDNESGTSITAEQNEKYNRIVEFIDNHNLLDVRSSTASALVNQFATKKVSNVDRHVQIEFALGVLNNTQWHSSLNGAIITIKEKLVQANR